MSHVLHIVHQVNCIIWFSFFFAVPNPSMCLYIQLFVNLSSYLPIPISVCFVICLSIRLVSDLLTFYYLHYHDYYNHRCYFFLSFFFLALFLPSYHVKTQYITIYTLSNFQRGFLEFTRLHDNMKRSWKEYSRIETKQWVSLNNNGLLASSWQP